LLSGLVVVVVVVDFSPLQHDFEDADLSVQDVAQDEPQEDPHDLEQDSAVFVSALTSFVSAAFLLSSFLGSLSKFAIST
jgi:hypothetical protein